MMLVTHDMGVIAETADRVAVMYAGRVAEIGPVREVVKHANPVFSRPDGFDPAPGVASNASRRSTAPCRGFPHPAGLRLQPALPAGLRQMPRAQARPDQCRHHSGAACWLFDTELADG
jgi:peptide/nickel transport system ATP-binding protein